MTDSEFKKLLSDPEKLSGGYLFFGEEDFVKSRYADLFAKAVVGDESFSAISIEGPEMTPSALAEALGHAVAAAEVPQAAAAVAVHLNLQRRADSCAWITHKSTDGRRKAKRARMRTGTTDFSTSIVRSLPSQRTIPISRTVLSWTPTRRTSVSSRKSRTRFIRSSPSI